MGGGRSDLARKLLIVAAIIYVISPVDLMPGVPIDDVIALIAAVAGYRGLGGDDDRHGQIPAQDVRVEDCGTRE